MVVELLADEARRFVKAEKSALAVRQSLTVLSSLYGRERLLQVMPSAATMLEPILAPSSPSSPSPLPPKSDLSTPLETLKADASRDDFALSAGLFLTRKVLPAPSPDVKAYLTSMSTPSPPVNKSFLESAQSEIRKIFGPGWDESYARRASRIALPETSCLENSGRDGGARFFGIASWSQEQWIEMASGRLDFSIPSERKVARALCKGKERLVTIQPVLAHVLRPLHDLIYDTISRQRWLLRGEPPVRVMNKFAITKGEVFVSGDYESATDNLNLHHSKSILEMILDECVHVPESIKREAVRSMVCELRFGTWCVGQGRGQLMGNLLSFPLLCLTNWFTLVHALGSERARQIPVFINGDDIVFRSSMSEKDRWVAAVAASGLKLSLGKTLIHQRFFSINSTFFESFNGGARLVPVIRAALLFGESDGHPLTSFIGRAKSCAWGFSSNRKRIVQTAFLYTHRGEASRISGSLLMHGIRFSEAVLKTVGLWKREVRAHTIPACGSFVRAQAAQVLDDNFRFVRTKVSFVLATESALDFSEECRRLAWIPRSIVDPPDVVTGLVEPLVPRISVPRSILEACGFPKSNPERARIGSSRGSSTLLAIRRRMVDKWSRDSKKRSRDATVVSARAEEWLKGVGGFLKRVGPGFRRGGESTE